MVCLPAVENEMNIGAASGTNDSFDVEVAITGLLADPSRTSVELPPTLDAEQRKRAKKIIEQHPNLKCESYGLGQDRQMHVFKRPSGEYQTRNYVGGDSISECSPQSVSVKNTFIDDWIQPDGMPADGRIVQSMPHNMFAQRLSAEMSGHVPSTVKESSDATALPVNNEGATSAVDEHQYALGTEVVIDGLIKAPMFNGAYGVVQSWDADSNRYNIMLTVATVGGHRWAKVKGENLRLALPQYAPSISFGCFDQ